ncbi:MAG TPA: hypothetical protein VJ726_03880 [Candidatus Limnocylindria bacterium]|nr:hypothetical protein [Candidatus Limnocylindria bacterium]
MRVDSIVRLLTCGVAATTIACGGSPTAGSGTTAAPSASPTVIAYLDDRSSPEQLIRSYYDAIGRRQHLRAYSYWEASNSLPSYDAFAKGFADTSAVHVELGIVGGGTAAGQLYWSVPAAVFSTTSGASQTFVGCYTLHLSRPEIQAAPPFRGIAIQAAQLTSVSTPAAARSGLTTACGSANATPLPWGAPGSAIDATHYVDDRSGAEETIRSLYNAVNRKEYARAYSYWEPGASGLSAFTAFAASYANTKSVTLLSRAGASDVGAGQLYFSVPVVLTVAGLDGSATTFSGCYKLHLGSPNAQATPPYQPLGIQSARITQAAAGSNASDLLGSACS